MAQDLSHEIISPYVEWVAAAERTEQKAFDKYVSVRGKSIDKGKDYLTDKDRATFADYETAKGDAKALKQHEANFAELSHTTESRFPSYVAVHLDFIMAGVLASHRVGRDNPMLFGIEMDRILERLTTPEAVEKLYQQVMEDGIFSQFVQRIPLKRYRGDESRQAAYNEALKWMGLDCDGLNLLNSKIHDVRNGTMTAGQLRQEYAKRDVQMIEDWPVILRMKYAALDPDKVTEFAAAARPYLDARRAAAREVVKAPFAPAPAA